MGATRNFLLFVVDRNYFGLKEIKLWISPHDKELAKPVERAARMEHRWLHQDNQ